MTILIANTATGVHQQTFFEGDLLSGADFYDVLDTLKDGIVVCAIVSDAMFAKIDNEYGVN